MLLELIGLVVGLVLLVKGSDWLVDSAQELALSIGVPASVIGLTIVALGTSVPEFVVGIDSALRGAGQIAIGNVIGSNIVNLCLVIGVAAIVRPIVISRSIARIDLPVTFGVTLVFLIMSLDGVIGGIDGAIMIILGIIYLASIYRRTNGAPEAAGLTAGKMFIRTGFLGLGIACVLLGGKVTVDSAVSIATALQVSPYLIALTVIALGTSLPELATSITAARQDLGDLVLGNCLGSAIANILFVLGASAMVAPLPVAGTSDMFLLLVITALLLPVLLTRSQVGRKEGLFLVAIYALYIGYKVITGAIGDAGL